MPQIDSMRPAKRGGLILLSLSDGSFLRLSPDTVVAERLAPGIELTEQRIEALSAQRLSEQVRRTAANIISACALSTAELSRRLVRKGYPEAEAEAAVEWLVDIGLLDDRAYAAAVCEKCANSGISRRVCAQKLREKGVPAELAQQVLESYPEPDGALDRLVEKKLRGSIPDREGMAKVIAALARKGFAYEDIRAALRRATDGAADDYGE